MKRMMGLVALVGMVALAGCSHKPTFISGSLVQYQPVTLDFNGPMLREVGPANPFTDYRMTVRFSKKLQHGQSRVLDVPGYFAADGNAAESSATDGHVWRVHFLPDEPGEWEYEATLLYGLNAATDDSAQVTPIRFSGTRGKLNIAPADGEATGFYRTGPLRYANCRYLRFDSGKPFLIHGLGSPENFLAYADFDGARDDDHARPRFLPHVKDGADDLPTWQNGKGKGILGAVNYLAGQGVNCLSFSTYNIDGGNHQDVWVWSTPAEKLHFDVSRLAQWNIVFTHMARLGVAVQLVMQESGNDNSLSGGQLGHERKLYYRELIARFAHQPGLIWNLGRANGNTDRERAEFAAYIHRLDPYKHPIVIHAADGKQVEVFTPLLGFHALSGVGLPSTANRMNGQTLAWVNRSGKQNHKWIVVWNNQAGETPVVRDDATDPSHDAARQGLWANLLAGGSGAIWSLGAEFPGQDPAGENFRRFEGLWRQGRIAMDFLQEQVPLTLMASANSAIKTNGPAWCLAGGDAYLVYIAQGQPVRLKTAPGRYEVIWLNPRTGETTGLPKSYGGPAAATEFAPQPADAEPIAAAEFTANIITSAGELILAPPTTDGKDWVVLLRVALRTDHLQAATTE